MKRNRLIVFVITLSLILPLFKTGEAFANSIPPSQVQSSLDISSRHQDHLQLSKDQLQVKDNDIDTWMPNKSLQAELLKKLISGGFLPEGSTVNQITKELLGSLDSSANFFLEISTFKGDTITSNVSEGLQYVNPTADISLALVDADESQLMNVDLGNLNNNVDNWYLEIYNPQQIEHPQLMNKIIDAKLPAKSDTEKSGVFYIQGTFTNNGETLVPSIVKNIDISQTYFPSVTLNDNDFWHEIDKTQYTKHLLAGSLDKTNGMPILYTLYSFKPISETSYLGTITPNSMTTAAMHQVYNNPQYYLADFNDTYTYDDGEHQSVTVTSKIFGNFIK